MLLMFFSAVGGILLLMLIAVSATIPPKPIQYKNPNEEIIKQRDTAQAEVSRLTEELENVKAELSQYKSYRG